MFVRLIFNYIKNQKLKQGMRLLERELENHPLREPDPVPEENTKEGGTNNNDIKLTVIESIDLNINKSTYVLTLEHASQNWEDDDILLSRSSSGAVFIHPHTFLKYAIASECNYLNNQDDDFLKNVENTDWFKFTYLEDSRDYPSIIIEGQPTSIKCHYLCPMFYIGNINDRIILIIDNLYDENMDQVPKIFTTITDNIFSEASATFDIVDELWQNTNA